MGDRPRHAAWQVAKGWRFGAILTAVWLVLAVLRWSAYLDGATGWRLFLALLSSALTVGYLAATGVLWSREQAANRRARLLRARERTGRHARPD